MALHLASSNPEAFKAVVIENTFLSIEDVAPKVSSSPSRQHLPHFQCHMRRACIVKCDDVSDYPHPCLVSALPALLPSMYALSYPECA